MRPAAHVLPALWLSISMLLLLLLLLHVFVQA